MTSSSKEERAEELESALEAARELYSAAVEEHGASHQGVCWPSEASHELRFQKLTQVLADGPETFTVGDFGCGYGAMFEWFERAHPSRVSRYHGLDISSAQLEVAKKRCASPRATFELGSVFEESVDYAFVSGTFNVRSGASEETWTRFVEETLLHLAEKTTRGLAFNLLSTYVDWKEDHLFYADPLYFFDFCKSRIAKRVFLAHDYPLYEWTIGVLHD